MFEVTVEQTFAAGHALRHYKGKCENVHGHNYRVQVTAEGDQLNSIGLLVDFVELKRAMMQVIDRLDHANINDLPPFDRLNPTAEHIAQHIAETVGGQIDDGRVCVVECHVWETDRSCAIYRR